MGRWLVFIMIGPEDNVWNNFRLSYMKDSLKPVSIDKLLKSSESEESTPSGK